MTAAIHSRRRRSAAPLRPPPHPAILRLAEALGRMLALAAERAEAAEKEARDDAGHANSRR
jgi:hypothetical protein